MYSNIIIICSSPNLEFMKSQVQKGSGVITKINWIIVIFLFLFELGIPIYK